MKTLRTRAQVSNPYFFFACSVGNGNQDSDEGDKIMTYMTSFFGSHPSLFAEASQNHTTETPSTLADNLYQQHINLIDP